MEVDTDAAELTSNVKPARRAARQHTNPNNNLQMKDAIMLLFFLAGIAGIYTNVNERLVKLETKGDLISQQLAEMKLDTSRMLNKLDDTTRNLQNQVRDLEQLISMNKK